MKKEVWIFGDSYADKNYKMSDHVTWPEMLDQKYNVKNFALVGTGPTWSLNLLINELKNNDTNKVSVIFLSSNTERLDLSFLEDNHQVMLKIFDANGKAEKKLKKRYTNYLDFIKKLLMYYVFTPSFKNTELLKIIGVLKLLSDNFEKILVWPIFEETTQTIRNSEKFYFVKNKLKNLDSEYYSFNVDPRSNHLSENKHIIMFNQLSQWIDNNQEIDLSIFDNKK
jgi:hypothetical protein